MYQNYYEQVARGLVDAIRQSNLPARVRANDDHSITLELFGIYEKIRPVDSVIGGSLPSHVRIVQDIPMSAKRCSS